MFPILNPPSHPSGSSQCISPDEHPVSCIEPELVICFTYDNIHVSMLFPQIIPSSPSPTESKSLFFMSVSLLLSRIQGHHYHLSKFHIYMLIYCTVTHMFSQLTKCCCWGLSLCPPVSWRFIFFFFLSKVSGLQFTEGQNQIQTCSLLSQPEIKLCAFLCSVQSAQSLSCVRLFATP